MNTPGPLVPVAELQDSALMALISRAATDPSFDVAKMEALLGMHERIASGRKEALFNASMTDAQRDMGPVSADASNPQTHSKYASYAKLDKAVRPIYTRYGFALSFDEGTSDKPDYVRVLCLVSHNAGFSRTYHADMPADGKGAKGGDVMTKTHATGAAKSYGKRYLLKDIFNIAVGEEDLDGNAPVVARISAAQVKEIEALLTKVPHKRDPFMRYYKIEKLEDILATSYPTIIAELNKAVVAKKKAS